MNKAVLIALIILIASAEAAAQNLSILGTVTDQSNTGLGGVTVTAIAQTERTTITNSVGHFEFVGLPDGIYTLTFEKIGFQGGERGNVVVRSGQRPEPVLKVLRIEPRRARLTGRIADQEGAAVAHGQVSATNRASGRQLTTSTNEDGEYALDVDPGNYEIKVVASNFKTYTRESVAISVSQTARIDVTLGVGDTSSTVTVSGGQIDLTESSVVTPIDEHLIRELPLNGRRFMDLAMLTPGAHRESEVTSRSNSGFSINGQRSSENSFIIDGVETPSGESVTNISKERSPRLPADTIFEFKVSSFEHAESGNTTGGTLFAVTKTGSNEVKGDAFYVQRNSALAARDFFETHKAHFLMHQFGLSVGGPIVKERVFYFGAYEGKRELQARPRLLSVPSSARLAPARSILVSGGLPENALSTRLLQFFPSPDRAGIFNNLTLNSPAINDSDNVFVRLDSKVKGQDIFVAYNFARSDQLLPVTPSFLPGFRTRFTGRVQSLSGSVISTIRYNLNNQVWVRYDRNREGFLPEDSDFDPASIGLNTGVTDPGRFGLPLIKVVGFDALGSAVDASNRLVATTWQIKDIFRAIRGRQTISVGGGFSRAVLNGRNDAGTRGRIVFDGSVLGDPLADFLGGFPAGNTAIVRGDTQRTTSIDYFDSFVQDEIRFKSIFLNLGVRYEINSRPGGSQLSGFNAAAGGLVQVGSPQLSKLFASDRNNFAPRLGIAWNPTSSGNLALRANWGLFTERPALRLFSDLCPCPNTLNAGVNMNPVGERPATAIGSARPVPFGIGIPVFSGPGLVDLSVVDPKLRNPTVQNYYLGIQYRFLNNTAFEAGYSGSTGTHGYRLIDINQPTPGDPATRNSRRPFFGAYPQFGAINMLTSSARSNYHALRLSLERRVSSGLELTAGYTWSKSIDEASDPSALPQDSHNLRAERAPSTFDQRHRFIVSWLYDSRSARKKWLRGWQVAGVVRAESGNPFTPLLAFDNSGTATFMDRPNLIGDPRIDSRTQLYTASAFTIPVRGTFGNAGRNSLVGPGLYSWDAGVTKRIPILNDRYLELHVEALNLFNHPNFRTPVNIINEPAFGSVTATDRDHGRRKIQFRIRFTF